MSNYKMDTTLNEKDSLQDMLNLEKQIVKVYATAITEGTSKEYRNAVIKILTNSIERQLNVFLLMTELDYAKVKGAEQTVISEEKNKFLKVKTELE